MNFKFNRNNKKKILNFKFNHMVPPNGETPRIKKLSDVVEDISPDYIVYIPKGS